MTPKIPQFVTCTGAVYLALLLAVGTVMLFDTCTDLRNHRQRIRERSNSSTNAVPESQTTGEHLTIDVSTETGRLMVHRFDCHCILANITTLEMPARL
jgi:hypothetical protein